MRSVRLINPFSRLVTAATREESGLCHKGLTNPSSSLIHQQRKEQADTQQVTWGWWHWEGEGTAQSLLA